MTPADRIAKQELDALKALVERLGNSREVGQPGERLPPLVEQVYLRIAQLEAAYRKLDDDMHDALMVVQREKLATEHERDAALKRYDDLRQKYEALVLEYSACEDKRGDTLALNAKLVEALKQAAFDISVQATRVDAETGNYAIGDTLRRKAVEMRAALDAAGKVVG